MAAARYLKIAAISTLLIGLTAGGGYLMLRAAGSGASRPPAHGHGPGKDDHGHKHDDGKVKMTDAQVAAAAIEVLPAEAGTIRETIRLNGMIQTNQEAQVQVTRRDPRDPQAVG